VNLQIGDLVQLIFEVPVFAKSGDLCIVTTPRRQACYGNHVLMDEIGIMSGDKCQIVPVQFVKKIT
jgi:hypothetical protein